MNIDFLKQIYDAFGTPHPRISLLVVMVLAALVAGALWYSLGKQVEKGRRASVPQQVSGPASTSGTNSPAVTGNGNTLTYSDAPTAPAKEKEKK
ncbi:MAG TPA: hypothetical protein VHV29_14470 [Terriglobales bacterium]|jgi:hypothetical protein|nr:hypothetical protein [Terriglobales bacterium]